MKHLLLAGVVVFLLGAFVPALAIPPPLPPLPETLKSGELVLDFSIAFVAGTDQFMTHSPVTLFSVWRYLQARSEVSLLRIEAHTTVDDGDPASSQLLSERRALAVARDIIERGIDCKRLIAVGVGASRPLYDSRTPQQRAYNQRIIFVVAAVRGKAVGGLPANGGGKIAGDLCAAGYSRGAGRPDQGLVQ